MMTSTPLRLRSSETTGASLIASGRVPKTTRALSRDDCTPESLPPVIRTANRSLVDGSQCVLGNEYPKPALEFDYFASFGLNAQLRDLLLQLQLALARVPHPADGFVCGRFWTLEREVDLLHELLARTLTDEFHLYVLLGLEPRKLDQVARKLRDSHGFAHVENERVTHPGHDRGLEH